MPTQDAREVGGRGDASAQVHKIWCGTLYPGGGGDEVGRRSVVIDGKGLRGDLGNRGKVSKRVLATYPYPLAAGIK
jgi:hypothetical protein